VRAKFGIDAVSAIGPELLVRGEVLADFEDRFGRGFLSDPLRDFGRAESA
jgi:hypothetical protein